jgi:protein-tyrosine kinase
MGRMLDALRRTDNLPSGDSPDACSNESEPRLAAAEEVPFIEVGPRKSMEASPSVLACAPAAAGPGSSGTISAGTISAGTGVTPVVSPRRVQFRALPGRAAPRSAFAAELVAYHAPDQPAAVQYRQVLDAVRNASAAHGHPAALLFSSTLPRGGATTTLLNVAISAAQQNQRILVVDANFRRPAVAEYLGLPAAPGLREVMAGTVALEAVIQPTEQAQLFAATAGFPPRAGGESGDGARFVAETLRSLLRQLRQRYPLVFVDAPPWDGRPDVQTLAAACDALFLVMPEAEAETPRTDALLRLIAEQGARVAGCILVTDGT